jgi:hypothetical protein
VIFNNDFKLTLIKSLHTLVWLVMTAATVWIFRSILRQQFDVRFKIALGLISVEVLVLLVNRFTCPLTPLARSYSDSQAPNFDIYLPAFLARHNKTIFSGLFALMILLHFWMRSQA